MSGPFVVIRMRIHCLIFGRGLPQLPRCRALPSDLSCLPHKSEELTYYRVCAQYVRFKGCKTIAVEPSCPPFIGYVSKGRRVYKNAKQLHFFLKMRMEAFSCHVPIPSQASVEALYLWVRHCAMDN